MAEIIEVEQFKKNNEYEKGLEAIYIIRDICCKQTQEICNTGRCPLNNWCHRDREDYPYNWY